jgi:hypothetical protein
MVGKGRRLMTKPKVRMNEVTAKYIGAPHKLGGKSIEEGFDCFSLLLELGEEFGVEIPDEFEDLDRDNYVDLFEEDRAKAAGRMVDFIKSVAEEIPIHTAFVGDIYVLEDNKGNIFTGIHAGNDLIFSSFFGDGVKCNHLRHYKIRSAYRWVVQ